MFRISCVCLALCFLIFPIGAAASPAPWTFNPPTAGRALQSGGWMVEYRLGSINASPEFSFPLQLIYLTTRTQEGLFGHGWFSPQLESSLIPVGKGALVWTMPSGGQMLLQENPDDLGDYRSADHVWKAELSPVLQKISNEDGWEYQFSKGKLIAVLSPGHRILEFDWRGTQLEGIQVRDLASNNRRVLLVAVYGANKRIAGFKLDGQPHKFAYLQDGTAERLSAWSPPAGEMAQFLYQRDSGILIKTGVGNTNDPGRIEEFKTQFVNPGADGTAAGVILARKKMENYWLIEDRNCSYAYGRLGKDQKQWDPSDITVTWRTGLVQKMTYAEQRGIVTSRQDGVERKSYYYRAPGQKYDGKLRRIEENGNLTAEYRYDRKTGLLTETVDAGGVITFYDYDPAFRPSRLVAWEPKPLRV